jgi:predicted amidophosphoribosyltransferase
MKCSKCQSKIREGTKFCENCGARLEIICQACSAHIPIGAKFCGECGSKPTSMAESILEEVSFDEKIRKLQKY